MVIRTREKKVFEGQATSVSLPGREGRFELLDHHTPLVSPLRRGSLEYTTHDKKESLSIKGGLVEVQANCVVILLEEAV